MTPKDGTAASGLLRLARWGAKWEQWWAAKTLPHFATPAEGFEMKFPRSIVNPSAMRIGSDVKLGPGSELKATTRYPGGWLRHPQDDHVSQTFEPRIVIGDRVTATASLQVAAFKEVVIEDDVMFAANVFVADGTHASLSGDVPYKYQGITTPEPIRIGRGAWIGQNAVILPGVTIGELAIVAANSVVNRDVPPRTIVAGSPARAIKRYDIVAQEWRRVDGEDRDASSD